MNGPSKNARLAIFKPNSRGLVVSYFYGGPSRSLDFFFNAKEVSGSQKMYQSRRLAKSRIYHSTPLQSMLNSTIMSNIPVTRWNRHVYHIFGTSPPTLHRSFRRCCPSRAQNRGFGHEAELGHLKLRSYMK